MAGLYTEALVSGIAVGSTYSLVALGITQTYTVTRVLNFGQAGFAIWGAYLYAVFTKTMGLPVGWAAVLSIAAVTTMGYLAEVIVFRYAAKASLVNRTILTFGMLQFLSALAVWRFSYQTRSAVPLMPEGGFKVLGTPVTWQQAASLAAVALVVIGVEGFLRFTRAGLITRAVAEDAVVAQILGASKNRSGAINWMMSAGIGALAGVLAASLQPFQTSTFLEYFLLAVVASLIGGLRSLLVTAIGGLALGVLVSEAGVKFSHVGTAQLMIFIGLALFVMLKWSSRGAGARVEWSRPSSSSGFSMPIVLATWAVFAGAWVWLLVEAARFDFWGQTGAMVFIYVMTGLSLVPLVGWCGQVSLAQAGFMGIGAFTFNIVYQSNGWGMPAALAVSISAGVGAGLILGAISCRLPFVQTAIVTLVFTGLVSQYLLYSGIFQSSGGQIFVSAPSYMDTGRSAMLVLGVAAALVALLLANLKRSQWGLRFYATRTSPAMLQHFGVSPSRVKILSFALSGGIAAFAGVLYILVVSIAQPSTFGVSMSLEVLLYGVLGGLTSLAGPFVGSLFIVGAPQVINLARFGSTAIPDIISGAGVMQVMASQPDGMSTTIRLRQKDQDRLVTAVRGRFRRPPERSSAESRELETIA